VTAAGVGFPSHTGAVSFGPGLTSDGVGPFAYVSRIQFGAPAPLGAPFATEMLGVTPSRAPPMPSIVLEPEFGSNSPVGVTRVTTRAGRSNVLPPSNERITKIASCRVRVSVPSQTT
jgi:hypothetical protein